jgi:hypothetical protein
MGGCSRSMCIGWSPFRGSRLALNGSLLTPQVPKEANISAY